jgi:hypothetical protein
MVDPLQRAEETDLGNDDDDEQAAHDLDAQDERAAGDEDSDEEEGDDADEEARLRRALRSGLRAAPGDWRGSFSFRGDARKHAAICGRAEASLLYRCPWRREQSLNCRENSKAAAP